jgi:hypothetical protein
MTEKNRATAIGWAIVEPGCVQPLIWSFRPQRKIAIQDFEWSCGRNKYSWPKLVKEGYRVAKFAIVEIVKMKP